MDATFPAEPDADELLVHRDDRGDNSDAYFYVGTNYGTGEPHYFVTLDENGGERSWWLDPECAAALGTRLAALADQCRQLNAEQAEREEERPRTGAAANDPGEQSGAIR